MTNVTAPHVLRPDDAPAVFKPLALPEREAHVWLARPEDAEGGGLLDEYRRILDPHETARLDRFRFERDRRTFLVAHALLRSTLSHYAPVAPAAWRFAAGDHGRPEIAWGGGSPPPLRFNVSRRCGLVACAVTRSADVGVDVEDTSRLDKPLALARDVLAAEEVATIDSLPTECRRQQAFYELWTLKEAYLKARGVGLGLPLDSFAFGLGPVGRAAVLLRTEGDDPKSWQFHQECPTPGYVLAAAVRRSGPGEFTFRVRRTVPLAD
jgi:4'-phosphopantetheinyl transferase